MRQVGRDGTILRQFRIDDSAMPGQTGRNWHEIDVQGNFLWVAGLSGAHRLDKSTGVYTGHTFGSGGGGVAYDPDRHLLWSNNWIDGRFEAYDSDTGRLVFQSAVLVLPLPRNQALTQGTKDVIEQNLWGHNLAYGAGRLWVGSENFVEDVIYGIRVK